MSDILELTLQQFPFQQFDFEFNGDRFDVTLRFNPISQGYMLSVQELLTARWLCRNTPLVLGSPALYDAGEKIVIIGRDLSETGLDPIQEGDLGARIQLTVMENSRAVLDAYFQLKNWEY